MNPRTPVSTVAGLLVGVSLFGLMESMVHGPEHQPAPEPRPLDPFVATDPGEPPPPPVTRTVPERPDLPERPTTPTAAATTVVEMPIDAPGGIALPPTKPGEVTRVTGPGIGEHGGRPGSDAACASGAPAPRFRVAPDYPRAQRAAGVEGEVEVELTVGADGRVATARVLRATPRGAFEAATLRAVKRWVYEARAAGCPGDAVALREVVGFRLEGEEE